MEWNNSINDTHFTRMMCFPLGQYFQHALCHCGRPRRIRGETFVPRAYLALLRYAYVCRGMAAVLFQPLLTHFLGWAPLLVVRRFAKSHVHKCRLQHADKAHQGQNSCPSFSDICSGDTWTGLL